MLDLPCSWKQYKFILFLAKKLGFDEEDFTKRYINLLFIKKKEDVIISLKNEINNRIKKIENKPNILSRNITATEIENYTYCPVSFAINRTFVLPTTEEAEIGSDLHEQQIFVKKFKNATSLFDLQSSIESSPFKKISWLDQFMHEHNSTFINDIRNSDLIFPLKDDIDDNIFYTSQDGSYSGKPDYIFRNKITNEIFVVEEKYHRCSNLPEDLDKVRFYDNHLNQLRSYMFGIKELSINYGYLVYWKYTLSVDYYNDHIKYKYSLDKKCFVKRIDKSPAQRQPLVKSFNGIRSLLKQQGGTFSDEYRHPVKCAYCVSSLLCGHKTGKFDKFTIPYLPDYFSIKKVEFPDELFKIKGAEELHDLDRKMVLVTKIFKLNWWYFRWKFESLFTIDERLIDNIIVNWIIQDNKLFIKGGSLSVYADYQEPASGRYFNLKEIISDEILIADWISSKVICYQKIEVDQSKTLSDEDIYLKLAPYHKIELNVHKGIIINYKIFEQVINLAE